MAGTSFVKFYKSASSGLGGAISGTQIVDATFNNFFGNVPRNEQVAGEDYFLCMYAKNTHDVDAMDNFAFWLDHDSPPPDTTIKWGLDAAGKNGTAQTIANFYASPTSVTWHAVGTEPATPNIGKLEDGDYYPIWVWWHVDANAVSRIDDTAVFNFTFFIPAGGTGGGGTGGGTATMDRFGIRQIYATKSGGRTYTSNWDLPATTTHQWDGTSGQDFGNFDPQDNMADLVCPATNRAIVDAEQDVLIATTNSNKNSWRYYVKDHLDDETSSTWKWDPSLEITVYYKAISDYDGGSIHVHCRVMGPTEHWLALNTCSGAGHEYSYEIKKNLVNQFRKEEFHIEPDSGYCDNIEFDDNTAPYNQWIGMKLCTHIKGTKMLVEAFKDLTDGANGGTWVKKGEILDDGTNWKLATQNDIDNYASLATGTGNCTKIPTMDQALTMACSAVGLRVDNTLVHFKKFSVREIDPDDEGSGGGGGTTPPPDPGGGNPPPTPTNWKMAVAGDWGCGSVTNSVINLCKQYDFTMGVGDNAYASASCWTSAFAVLKPKLNSAYGNHEYQESGGIAPYKTFFGHSKTYFSFNFQNVHIVVIDSNINMDAGSAQHDFVTADLTAASANSSIDWIFAVLHHPMFGASSDHSYNDRNSVQAFHSLFMAHKVAFVFAGHNHNWQRTNKVAYNSGSPTNPTNVDTSSPFVNDTTGFIHVVTGTGGHDSGGGLYSLGSQPGFQGFQNRTHNGIYEIVASNNGKTLTCSFVDKDGTSKFDTIVYNKS